MRTGQINNQSVMAVDDVLLRLWLIGPPLNRDLVERLPTSVYYKLICDYGGFNTVGLLGFPESRN